MNDYNEQLLNEYVDGTADDEQRKEAEILLNQSAEARAFLADLQHTFTLLDELDELPLKTDLSEQIIAHIEAPAPSPIWTRWILALQFMAAALLLTQLWPSMQAWLMRNTLATTTLFTEFSWPQLSLDALFTGWETAVIQQFQTSIPSLNLATNQWSLLIMLAFAAWLAGNRLLFNNESSNGKQ